MAARNLEPALRHIFGHEGGYSDIRSDPGNWTGGKVGAGTLKGTKYGIAANTYGHLDIRNLTLAKAADIYRDDYAKPIRFDDLPSGLDLCLLDYAINSGPARAVISLQRVLGIADDGKLGPLTLAAIARSDAQVLINSLCAARLAFLKQLSTWGKFGKGWSRRVEEVRAEALKLAAERPVRREETVPAPKPRPAPPPPASAKPAPKRAGGKIAALVVVAAVLVVAVLILASR